MSYFELLVCVLLFVNYFKWFKFYCVFQNVLMFDLLLIICDLIGIKFVLYFLMDGVSMMLYLKGEEGNDIVFVEYMGEGIVCLMMMICCGFWKYIICFVDVFQFYNFDCDLLELDNLV